MITKYDKKRPLIRALSNTPYYRIAIAVVLLDSLTKVTGRSTSVGRMILLTESPEHVLYPIRRIEKTIKQPVLKAVKFV